MTAKRRGSGKRIQRLSLLITQSLDRASRCKTSDEKGEVFEGLLAKLFSSIPGVTHFAHATLVDSKSEEIDLSFFNSNESDGLNFLETFVLLVECKFWSKPVGSNDVDWFVTKLRNRRLGVGILVAANGVTGGEDDRAARRVLANAQRDGIRVLVIEREDLETIETPRDIVLLLKKKLCELVLYGA